MEVSGTLVAEALIALAILGTAARRWLSDVDRRRRHRIVALEVRVEALSAHVHALRVLLLAHGVPVPDLPTEPEETT